MRSFSKTFSLLAIVIVAACGCKDDEGTPNPTLPTISGDALSASEGSGSTIFTFLVKLSNAFNKTVTVDYATANLTAEAGEDYVAASGTLSFAEGETEKMVTITILGDNWKEADEQFVLLLSNPANGLVTVPNIVGTILNDDTQDSDEGYTTPDNYAGYNLVWQDEFNGTAINTDDWTYDQGAGGWGNNELEYYTNRPENSYISDGKLVIEAKKESYQGAQYTSARMKTQGLKSFKYGRIDIRAKVPVGQGIWPALWMLGDNITTVGWPKCGEIDIMEVIGKEPSTLYGTPHWDDNGNHASYGGHTVLSDGTFADEYHVFSIVWDSQSIKWYLDDMQYHVIDITPAGLSELRENFFLIFNVAVGGNWPGNPDGTTEFPKQMRVDYVRVFQQ